MRWIRIAEMWAVTPIVGDGYALLIPDLGVQHLKVWREWLQTAHVDSINLPEATVATYLTMVPLRLPFIALLGLMAVWTMIFGPGTKFRRRMDIEGLMKEQSQSFPVIAPFLKFNPYTMPYRVVGGAVPSKLPLFAEALSPEEWVAFHEIPIQNGHIEQNRTYAALALQIGKRWRGPLELPLHAQGLYAAFALRHARKREASEALLNELSLSWNAKGGMKISGKTKAQIRKVIKDPKIGGALQKYADQHAYETTALLRCLARARQEGGVLAPASFLWLRGENRALWYPLNNLGRRSFHAEAVGALVHYTNELIAGQKIPTPRFDDVIKGIETFLKGPDAKPIPPLEKKIKK